ncbi:hypothetical protein V8B97DRAFT_1878229, partial [Scleroderma yunnanense]
QIGIDILHIPHIVTLIQRQGAFVLMFSTLSAIELEAFHVLTDVSHKQNKYFQLNWIHRWAVKEAVYI